MSDTDEIIRLRKAWRDLKTEVAQRDADCVKLLADYKAMCEERELAHKACAEAADRLNTAVDAWIGIDGEDNG